MVLSPYLSLFLSLSLTDTHAHADAVQKGLIPEISRAVWTERIYAPSIPASRQV